MRFRDETGPDLGQDATLEFPAGESPSGHRAWRNIRVGVQSKGRSNPRRRADGATFFDLEVKNLNYLSLAPALYWAWDDGRKRGYLQWRHDVVRYLDEAVPDWRDKPRVDVPFRHVATPERLRALGDDARTWYARSASMHSRGLVRDLLSGRLPEHLSEPAGVFGRRRELDELRGRVGTGVVVPVRGPLGSGKTTFVRRALEDPDVRTALAEQVSTSLDLLYLEPDARTGDRSLLRALWTALDEPVPNTFDERIDDLERVEQRKARMLLEQLPRRLGGAATVLVIDGFDPANRSAVDLLDAHDLLAQPSVARGMTLTAAWETVNVDGHGRRLLAPAIDLTALDATSAAMVLAERCGDATAAREAIGIVGDLDDLLYPGVLHAGAVLYRNHQAVDGAAPGPELLAESLIEATGSFVRRSLARLAVRLDADDGKPSTLAFLTAWALVLRRPLPRSYVAGRGLGGRSIDQLLATGWLADRNGDLALGSELRAALRAELLHTAARAPGELDTVTAATGQLLDELLHDEAGVDADAVEEGLAWLRRSRLAAPALESVLLDVLVVATADQPILPFTPADQRDARAEPDGSDSAAMVSAAVFAGLFSEDGDALATAVDAAVDVLTRKTRVADAELRALDSAAFFGSRRLRVGPMLLDARERLSDHLARPEVLAGLNVASLKWAASWVLNTGAGAANLRRPERASNCAALARTLIGRMPPADSPHVHADQQWMWSRLWLLESRLREDPQERLECLRRSQWHARDVLNGQVRERWLTYYLRATRRLANEERDDELRQQIVASARSTLEAVLGGAATWPLSVVVTFASVVRLVARRSVDPELQIELAAAARDLLEARRADLASWLEAGDATPTLELARAQEQLSYLLHVVGAEPAARSALAEARAAAERAVSQRPTAAGWLLLARIADVEDDRRGGKERGGKLGQRAEAVVAAARAWLEEQPASDRRLAPLALWLQQRTWRHHGSLLRVATADEGWQSSPLEDRRRILARLHGARRAALAKLEQRYGASVGLRLALATLEAQYQRALALNTRGRPYDPEPVLAIYADAQEQWPDSPRVLLERAQYERYIWALPEARRDFRAVIEMAGNGTTRRSATAELARVLVRAVTHGGIDEPADELLAEAREALARLEGFHRVNYERALLVERVELESGGTPDWEHIDEVYACVVGGIDSYPETIVRNLDALREGRLTAGGDFADVVQRRYTDAEALGDLGSLYLRRAEKHGTGLDDAARAYACFDAARIVQESVYGSERAVIGFFRASALIHAVRVAGTDTPFAIRDSGELTALDIAQRSLQRAHQTAVGGFKSALSAKSRELAAVRRELARAGAR